MDKALLSPKALAEAYDVPLSWVYNHVARRKLPFIKLGHYVRFDPEEMKRWLAQQRRGSWEAKSRGVDNVTHAEQTETVAGVSSTCHIH